jgi:hypothetical protein
VHFFSAFGKNRKMPVEKMRTEKEEEKGTGQVKKNRPHPNRGGAEIFKEFFSLVSPQPHRGLSSRPCG